MIKHEYLLVQGYKYIVYKMVHLQVAIIRKATEVTLSALALSITYYRLKTS